MLATVQGLKFFFFFFNIKGTSSYVVSIMHTQPHSIVSHYSLFQLPGVFMGKKGEESYEILGGVMVVEGTCGNGECGIEV